MQDHPKLDMLGRLFCLDVDLDPGEAILDKLLYMPYIRNKFRQKYNSTLEIQALVNTIVWEMFVFKLKGSPKGVL